MKNTILSVLVAVLIGYILSMFIFKEYDVEASGTDIYFIQYGVYSNYESMIDNTTNLDNYIYTYDKKYHVYIGFTKDVEVLNKLQGYFKSMDYNTYSKTIKVSDEKLLEVIDDYDLILKNVDNDSIRYVLKDMIKKYKEVINE